MIEKTFPLHIDWKILYEIETISTSESVQFNISFPRNSNQDVVVSIKNPYSVTKLASAESNSKNFVTLIMSHVNH